MNYVSIAIALCSLLLAGYSFLSRNNKENTTELTTVIVSLDSIKSGISDIKSEIAGLKTDQRDDHDRLIRLDASLKSAWKQIDKLAGTSEGDENRHD